MRRALKVLAKEWRRRGSTCPNAVAAVSGSVLAAQHTYLVSNMPPSLLQRQLTKLGACKESIAWAGQFSTARQAWEACETHEHNMWMWWLIDKYECRVADGLRNEVVCADIRRVVPFERLRGLSHGR
jgi:hypothetical protein